VTTAVVHAAIAAPLAELLPSRRGVAWTVSPAPRCIRAHAATSRLNNGERALDIVEQDGRIEVHADRADTTPDAPDAVVQAGPDAAAALAVLVLRVVLPRLEREAALETFCDHGRDQVIVDGAQGLNEVAYSLIDHGAHPQVVGRSDGVGVTWALPGGIEWGMWVLGDNGNLSLTYEGPVRGLYALLPVLLPPVGEREPADVGSAFTRHLADWFPQLRPVDEGEVEFGDVDVRGWIALPGKDEPTDRADDSRQVCAEFTNLGADLLLTAVPYLV
jgi:hypothetical protein